MPPPNIPQNPAPTPQQRIQNSPVQRQARAELTMRTREIKSMFDALEDGNVRTMPEALFVRDFLPLFGGFPNGDAKRLLEMWYLIAGTPYMPVNLIDQFGKFVIQVPAVLDHVQMNAAHAAPTRLGSALEEAKQVAQMSPRAGDAVIIKALNERVNRVEIPRTISAQWQKVFDHYKFTPYGQQEEKPQAEASKPAEDEGSAFDI